MGNIHTIYWPGSKILLKFLRIQIEDQKLKMPVYFKTVDFKTIHSLFLSWSRKVGKTKIDKKHQNKNRKKITKKPNKTPQT